jgi:phosphate transport system protein
MFKNIINFWKGKDFLAEVLKDFEEMLNDAETIFSISCSALLGKDGGEKDRIYQIDKKINANQKTIRKRILGHLTAQPTVDMPVSLVLMSVVKDAERLGDYSKNLFEVSELLEEPFEREFFNDHFDELDKKIKTVFDKTKQCFLQSDEKIANEIMDFEREIIKECDNRISKLAKSTLDTNRAVCSALVLRYLKRMGAHLGNIATSVIVPVSDLDYFDEKRRERTI